MRRIIGMGLISACCLLLGACADSSKSKVRFGVIADIQYCDCETRGSRFYRNSLEKLEVCVTDLNAEKVQFTVNLGDMVDRDTPGNLEAVLSRLNQLNQPVYNTPGNHDYGYITDNDALYKQMGMPASYYSFVQKGWRFVLLNTNEVASYANISGTPLEAELEKMITRIKEDGRRNGADYNGGISQKQLEWLRSELETAERKKEDVLVFSHHPLYAAPGLTAFNDLEIIELLAAYPCVKGAICGHHHAGDFDTYKDIPFITTEGMIETANENAYGIVDIYTDRIVFTGKGRSRSYTLPIPLP